MHSSYRFTAGSARFDEDNLVSAAGLVPLLGLAEQTGFRGSSPRRCRSSTSRIKSGAANPAPKLMGVIAGMCAGADSIDDLDVLRAGGMPILFDGVYAPSTLGTLLREFSFGHARQLESVLREHLSRWPSAPSCWPGSTSRRSSTSTRCCARSTGTPSRAPPTGTPRSPASRCCARDSRRWPPRSAPNGRAGARRDAAARGARPARARAPAGWLAQAIATARAAGAPGRSWSAATRPTATARWCAPAGAATPSSPWS